MLEKIREDMKEALRAREAVRLSALRMLLTDVHNAEIDKRRSLDEGEITTIIKKSIKSRNESREFYLKGNRPELAEKESQEITVLQSYLPPQLSEAEVEEVVGAAIRSLGLASRADLGRLMKEVMSEHGGRVDGKIVQKIALRLLSDQSGS